MSESERPFTTLCRDDEGALMARFEDPPSHSEFEAWAVDLARRIGATIGERIDTPEARLWPLRVGGETLTFLHAGERGTFLIAYEPSAEALLRTTRGLLETIAQRIGDTR